MRVSDGSMVPITPTDNLPICKSATEQIIYLTWDTPTKFIKKRVGRGQKVFDYIETNYVIGRLNAIFNFDWNLETVWQEVDKANRQVAVKVRLTVKFLDGRTVTKEAYGGSDVKMQKTGDMIDLADDLKSAESDGLKKAASLLGIGWDVYAGLAHAVDEAIDVDEEDDFTSGPSLPQQGVLIEYDPKQGQPRQAPQVKDQFRNINLQLANGRTVQVSKFEALGYFGKLKDALGEEAYYATLKLSGFSKSNEIPPDKIPAMYKVLVDAFRSRKKIEPEEKHEEPSK